MEIEHHRGFDSIITTEKDDKISAMDAVLGSIGSFHAFFHPLSVKSSEICTEYTSVEDHNKANLIA